MLCISYEVVERIINADCDTIAGDYSFHGSLRHQAQQLNTSRRKLGATRMLTAAATYTIHISALFAVINAVIKDAKEKASQLLLFQTSARYDETPMRLVLLDCLRAMGLDPTADVSTELGPIPPHVFRDAATSKLFQMEFAISLLIKLANGSFFMLTFEVLMPIRSIERTTADNYYLMLRQTEFELGRVLTLGKEFARRQRVSVTELGVRCVYIDREIASACSSSKVLCRPMYMFHDWCRAAPTHINRGRYRTVLSVLKVAGPG